MGRRHASRASPRRGDSEARRRIASTKEGAFCGRLFCANGAVSVVAVPTSLRERDILSVAPKGVVGTRAFPASSFRSSTSSLSVVAATSPRAVLAGTSVAPCLASSRHDGQRRFTERAEPSRRNRARRPVRGPRRRFRVPVFPQTRQRRKRHAVPRRERLQERLERCVAVRGGARGTNPPPAPHRAAEARRSRRRRGGRGERRAARGGDRRRRRRSARRVAKTRTSRETPKRASFRAYRYVCSYRVSGVSSFGSGTPSSRLEGLEGLEGLEVSKVSKVSLLRVVRDARRARQSRRARVPEDGGFRRERDGDGDGFLPFLGGEEGRRVVRVRTRTKTDSPPASPNRAQRRVATSCSAATRAMALGSTERNTPRASSASGSNTSELLSSELVSPRRKSPTICACGGP